MSTLFVPASDLHVIHGCAVEALADGAMRSLPGNHGFVFYGPYLPTAAGIYRIRANSRVIDPGKQIYFDLAATTAFGTTILCTREYKEPFQFAVYIDNTSRLEFRFKTNGEEFVLDGLYLEALMLDTQPVSVDDSKNLAETLLTIDDVDPRAMFRTTDRIAAFGETAIAEKFRHSFVTQPAEPAIQIRNIFLDLHRSSPTAGSDAIPHVARQQIVEEVAKWDIKLIDFLNFMTDQEQIELTTLGYQTKFFSYSALHRNYDEPVRRQHNLAEDGTSQFLPHTEPFLKILSEIDLSFQTSLCRGHGIPAYCPISGQLLYSNHGFYVHNHIFVYVFYFFRGIEPFYVCAGGWDGSRKFIFIPRTNRIIVPADWGIPRWAVQDYIKIVQEFCVDIIQYANDVRRYLDEPTKPAAVLGIGNLGQFFWNELSGIQHVFDNDLGKNLSVIIQTNSNFIDIAKLYPEIYTTNIVKLSNENDSIFYYCIHNNLTPVYFTDVTISDQLIFRIMDAAQKHSSHNGGIPRNVNRPLIWVNLRTHNKMWINQAIGYANILNALADEYGHVSALLDGMPDCKEIAAEIRESTYPRIDLYNNFNLPLIDCINWATAVDAYVCTIGSGLVLLTWLAGKPGVAHANTGHMNQLAWWPAVRPGALAPLAPERSEIHDVTEHDYANYDLDWRILLDLLRKALNQPTPA